MLTEPYHRAWYTVPQEPGEEEGIHNKGYKLKL